MDSESSKRRRPRDDGLESLSSQELESLSSQELESLSSQERVALILNGKYGVVTGASIEQAASRGVVVSVPFD